MELAALAVLARQIWVIWLLALFTGIILWVYWPRRRPIYERASRIPFDDQGKV
ncbi:MAG: cbb3-type cytochrome c oxidase subunit 3 [Alphaproteobacteria bacterium]|nr:cbb3-type cytochrome c oxidase subunit 3 [Alphaproteobacteria bacterium]